MLSPVSRHRSRRLMAWNPLALLSFNVALNMVARFLIPTASFLILMVSLFLLKISRQISSMETITCCWKRSNVMG